MTVSSAVCLFLIMYGAFAVQRILDFSGKSERTLLIQTLFTLTNSVAIDQTGTANGKLRNTICLQLNSSPQLLNSYRNRSLLLTSNFRLVACCF